MEVKVSIIIAVYNVSPFLDKCLTSCINQSFKEIEIIVVNDGSTDTSIQIIRKFATGDERIIVIDEENQGSIFARKSGLDIARGEYIFYLDGDDFIEENAIEVLLQKAINGKSDYVVGPFYEVKDSFRKECFYYPGFEGLSGQELTAYILGARWSLCGRLIKKSLFDDIVYKPIYMGDDLFVNMQITPKVKKAAWVEAYVYDYVRHSASVTARSTEVALPLYLEMLESIFYLLAVYTYDRRITEQVYLLFFSYMYPYMEEKKMEIQRILRLYYWDKKEVRAFLWKKKKIHFLIVGGFLYCPVLTGCVVKIGRRIVHKLR